MPQKTLREYRNMVRREAWKRFVRERSVLDVALTLLIGLLVAAGTSVFWRKPESWIDFLANDAMITAILFVIFSAVIYGFIYVYGYLKIQPSIIYNSQENIISERDNSIKLLQQELNLEPVEVNLDIYEWGFIDDTTNPESEMVCVVVKNLSGDDIRCYCALTMFFRLNMNDKSTEQLLGGAVRNGSLISWSGGGLNEDDEVLIKDGHDRIVNVAQGIGQSLIFKMQNLDFAQQKNGIYVFDIEVGGHNVKGKKFVPHKESFYIEYEKAYKTFAGGSEKPYSTSDTIDNINSTSVIKDYRQIGENSHRKLKIVKRNKDDDINSIP